MPPISDRRKRFKTALAQQERTQASFARQHKVTLHHLQQVLRGLRQSPRLNTLIDETIAQAEGAECCETPTIGAAA